MKKQAPKRLGIAVVDPERVKRHTEEYLQNLRAAGVSEADIAQMRDAMCGREVR